MFQECQDNRGHKLDEETGAYEARMFCEMLMKGAVNMVELVFAKSLLYTSEAWQKLTEQKQLFLSEKVILQYAGYVKTHLKIIKNKKHSGTPRERKIFYNVCCAMIISLWCCHDNQLCQPIAADLSQTAQSRTVCRW